MTDILLATWRAAPAADTAVAVTPDGCRDLIVRSSPGEKPLWFLSSLEHRTYNVSIKAGIVMQGFRLKPGARIDEQRLLASVQNQEFTSEDIHCRLNNYAVLAAAVAEAFACLASEVGSVTRAAMQLGVSQRTLQRLLAQQTGRSPAYWMSLARVRKSARAACEQRPLAEIAATHGYADQAHMSREFKNWLSVNPSKVRHCAELRAQLNESGYS